MARLLVARAAAAASLTALAMLLGACSDGKIVSSEAQQLYVRLPSNWTLYNAKTVEGGNSFFSGMGQSPEAFFEGASASPHPNPSDLFSPSAYPWAIIAVARLTSTAQLQMSVEGLSNVLIPIDELAEQGDSFDQLSPPQSLVKGTLHGSLVSFEFGTGSPNSAFDYEQSTWVNNSTTKAWVLIVGCSPTCYEEQHAVLQRVISSFYVSDRGDS